MHQYNAIAYLLMLSILDGSDHLFGEEVFEHELRLFIIQAEGGRSLLMIEGAPPNKTPEHAAQGVGQVNDLGHG
jgi:hypothetical protein